MQNSRLIWLGIGLGLLALINVAVFTGLFSDRSLNLHWRVIAQPSDDEGPYVIVQFALSDKRPIKSIQVQRLDEKGNPAETLWAVSGKSIPIDTFSFGTSLDGMERTDTHEGRPRLRPGQTYRIKLKTTGFKSGELQFET
tara:strand:- start:866 stop:1285 length:420 start_codon:yes stop_codon:yes gene_type:complete